MADEFNVLRNPTEREIGQRPIGRLTRTGSPGVGRIATGTFSSGGTGKVARREFTGIRTARRTINSSTVPIFTRRGNRDEDYFVSTKTLIDPGGVSGRFGTREYFNNTTIQKRVSAKGGIGPDGEYINPNIGGSGQRTEMKTDPIQTAGFASWWPIVLLIGGYFLFVKGKVNGTFGG